MTSDIQQECQLLSCNVYACLSPSKPVSNERVSDKLECRMVVVFSTTVVAFYARTICPARRNKIDNTIILAVNRIRKSFLFYVSPQKKLEKNKKNVFIYKRMKCKL